jgi:hypothetical protein
MMSLHVLGNLNKTTYLLVWAPPPNELCAGYEEHAVFIWSTVIIIQDDREQVQDI